MKFKLLVNNSYTLMLAENRNEENKYYVSENTQNNLLKSIGKYLINLRDNIGLTPRFQFVASHSNEHIELIINKRLSYEYSIQLTEAYQLFYDHLNGCPTIKELTRDEEYINQLSDFFFKSGNEKTFDQIYMSEDSIKYHLKQGKKSLVNFAEQLFGKKCLKKIVINKGIFNSKLSNNFDIALFIKEKAYNNCSLRETLMNEEAFNAFYENN